jgi:hypothetical protein
MARSRYDNRTIFKNKSEMFQEHFDKRDVNFINQYSTPVFNHIDVDQEYNIGEEKHIWKQGDRLYKLAYEYYSDPELWWVIAWYNQKPTETDYKVGEVVLIPTPLNEVLKIMGI